MFDQQSTGSFLWFAVVHASSPSQASFAPCSAAPLVPCAPPHNPQSCMVGHASTQCTGCSAAVVEAYKQRGWDLVLEALKVIGRGEDRCWVSNSPNATCWAMHEGNA